MIKKIVKTIAKACGIRSENIMIFGYKKYLPKKIKAKTALLSYLTRPFLPFSAQIPNNNWRVARNITKALNQSGFIVDIVNWQNKNFIPAKKYDLFIGHSGKNFEKITEKLNIDCLKIYFATGLYWKFHNEQEVKRIKEVSEKKGQEFKPDRIITEPEENALTKADAIIALGNEFCRKTYAAFPNVYTLDNFSPPPDKKFNLTKKNFPATKNNFLFLSGPGNIHKGLDLVLEAFVQSPDKNLYVCTKLDDDFAQAYRKELFETKNIRFIGFVKEFSQELRKIMYQCGYFIHPSCGEGSPGAALWALSYGLVPIISRESNLDLDSFEYQLPSNTVEEILKAIKTVSGEEYNYQKAEQIREYATKNFSEEIFLQKIKGFIELICQNKSRA